MRPSCYECKCKNGVNHSDLTIGDYWAARVTDQDFDDDKGIGLVLVYSVKGQEYFEKLNDMSVRESTLEKASLCNGGFNEHTKAHPRRQLFFTLINEGKTVEEAVNKCLFVPAYCRILSKLKSLAKSSVKRVLGDFGVKVIKKILVK